jgi:uncharacterized protein YlxP (DUF503 family)
LVVAVLTALFRVPAAQSLKDKRSVVQSLVRRTAQRYRVSAAEVGHLDDVRRAEVAVAVVSGDGRHAEQVLQAALRFMEESYPVELISGGVEQR